MLFLPQWTKEWVTLDLRKTCLSWPAAFRVARQESSPTRDDLDEIRVIRLSQGTCEFEWNIKQLKQEWYTK